MTSRFFWQYFTEIWELVDAAARIWSFYDQPGVDTIKPTYTLTRKSFFRLRQSWRRDGFAKAACCVATPFPIASKECTTYCQLANFCCAAIREVRHQPRRGWSLASDDAQ
jgi:hypothetical protein